MYTVLHSIFPSYDELNCPWTCLINSLYIFILHYPCPLEFLSQTPTIGLQRHSLTGGPLFFAGLDCNVPYSQSVFDRASVCVAVVAAATFAFASGVVCLFALSCRRDFAIFIVRGTKSQARKSPTCTPQRYYLRAIDFFNAQTTPKCINSRLMWESSLACDTPVTPYVGIEHRLSLYQ